MSLPCVNSGGPASLLRVAAVPQLEAEVLLGSEAVVALGCWRSRPGSIVTLVDAAGSCYRARLARLDAHGAALVPFVRLSRSLESPLALTVYQALPEKERFELILQKLTELGVARIVPYLSQRSTTLAEREAGQAKAHRWPEVVLRAARQCRRALLPELAPLLSFEQALQEAAAVELKLMLYEGTTTLTARVLSTLPVPRQVALLVGPEGGFAAAEVAQATAIGFQTLSLGPRILRTETAAIVGAGVIQFALGDLG